MPTLSLAMIVKNEAAFLGHCLGSVQGLVDDVVVVDTGSTDGTIELAERAGARVFQLPWEDDFAKARNASIASCLGDWILFLDADEALDDLDFPKVRAALAQEGTQAFTLVLRNYFPTGAGTVMDQVTRVNRSPYREGAAYSHYADASAIRLCRRQPGLAFTGRIHELLTPFFQERGLPVADLDVVVHHYGKVQVAREARKQAYYLDLARRDALAAPADYQRQFNLVSAAMVAGQWPEVLQAGEACRRLLPGFPEPMVLLGLGMACQDRGEFQRALAYLDELLAAVPGHSLALIRRSYSLLSLGRLEEAKASLRRASVLEPGSPQAWVNLAEIQVQCGEGPAARETLLTALEVSPGELSLLETLLRVDLQAQRLDLALADARLALAQQPGGGGGLWHRLVAVDLLQRGAGPEAARLLDQGLEAFPGNADLLRLRDLAVAP